MNKFVALPTKEKWPRMNEKMMTPTFFKLYRVYIKKIGQFFSHTLLVMHRSFGSYKYFDKLISEVYLRFFKNTVYMHIIPLMKL